MCHAMTVPLVALGEYKQRLKSGAIEVQLSFKFKDGSLHQETAVFSATGTAISARQRAEVTPT